MGKIQEDPQGNLKILKTAYYYFIIITMTTVNTPAAVSQMGSTLITDDPNPYPELIGYHGTMTTETEEEMDAELKDFLTDKNGLDLPEEYVDFLCTHAYLTSLEDLYLTDNECMLRIPAPEFVDRLGPILVAQHMTHSVRLFAFLQFTKEKDATSHLCVTGGSFDPSLLLPAMNRFKKSWKSTCNRMRAVLTNECNTLAANLTRMINTSRTIKEQKPSLSNTSVSINPGFASPIVANTSRTANLPPGTPVRSLFQATPVVPLATRLLANGRPSAAAAVLAATGIVTPSGASSTLTSTSGPSIASATKTTKHSNIKDSLVWDGGYMDAKKTIKLVDAHLIQNGMGYLTHSDFQDSYRLYGEQTLQYFPALPITGVQFNADISWLYGALKSVFRENGDSYVDSFKRTQDGLSLWIEFLHIYQDSGDKATELAKHEAVIAM